MEPGSPGLHVEITHCLKCLQVLWLPRIGENFQDDGVIVNIVTQDRTKLSEYVMKCFGTPLEEVELCVRGMNWGEIEFQGPLLRFMADKKPSFEITLNDVSNVTTGKNEVTLQFHQNDSAPVSLMEMRLHIPVTNDGEEDTLQVHGNCF